MDVTVSLREDGKVKQRMEKFVREVGIKKVMYKARTGLPDGILCGSAEAIRRCRHKRKLLREGGIKKQE